MAVTRRTMPTQIKNDITDILTSKNYGSHVHYPVSFSNHPQLAETSNI